MKRNFRSFISGCLATVVAVALIGTVSATIGRRTVEVDYNDIKVTLNGEQVELVNANGTPVEPFAINGTTYLPIRAIATALGLDVEWDGNTNTAILTNKNVIEQGTIIYEDEKVAIAFGGIRPTDYSFISVTYVDFIITNKTNTELDFMPSAISFDGISYQMSGMGEVAPNSTGTISFDTSSDIPTNVSTSTGMIHITDTSVDIFDEERSYDATWTNVGVSH